MQDSRTLQVIGGLVRVALPLACRAIVGRRADVMVEGAHYLPRTGPVVLAARHYHNAYDGCILIAVAPRPLHLLVALDWVRTTRVRRVMEAACRLAEWPIVLRADALRRPGHRGAYGRGEGRRYLRAAIRESVRYLHAGGVLVIFPEGYPNVDPAFTPKRGTDDVLPFHIGFVRIVELAQRDGRPALPIVPVGFSYQRGMRWRVTVRFGAPLVADGTSSRAALVDRVERQVRMLSGFTAEPAAAD